jgi:hypothetical protein
MSVVFEVWTIAVMMAGAAILGGFAALLWVAIVYSMRCPK